MTAHIAPSPLLRAALAVDSLASGIMGLGLTFAAGPLSPLLGLPQPLLLGAGLACVGWAAVTGWLARRPLLRRSAVWAVIAINAIWVVESLLVAFGGWVSLTGLGLAFVLLQALAVAAFAEAQLIGLKRADSEALAPA
jgi:hypothetical protein